MSSPTKTSTVHATGSEASAHTPLVFIESPTRLVMQLNITDGSPVLTADLVRVLDDQQHERIPVRVTRLPGVDGQPPHAWEVIVFEPLDVDHRWYRVRVDGFPGEAIAVPRRVLDTAHLYADHDVELGAWYQPTATTFRLFAPTARQVAVVLYQGADGDAGREVHSLQRGTKGIWEGVLPGDLEGRYYVYQLDGPGFSGRPEVVDPYAVNTVMGATRARITNLDTTNPPDWDRFRRGPAVASMADLVIWEMHVRDFTIAPVSGITRPGKFLGFAEAGSGLLADPSIKTGLSHLVELGVTHVQLLPVQDFGNDQDHAPYNWGYMTKAFHSPEGWFATNTSDASRIRELKQLIKTLHQHGIGVILDIVLNHTDPAAPFDRVVPNYYYRCRSDGTLSNGSGCGNDFRSESPMGRKYIIDTLRFWVEEYGVDGFRFDLMALLDAATMKEAERELRAINPHILLYGEPWAAGDSPIDGHPTDKYHIRGSQIGAFNDDFRNALKGSPNGHDGGFIQTGSHRDAVQRGIEGSWRDWAPQPVQSINYLSCHDNLVLYDKLKASKPHASDPEIIDMMRLAYLLLLTSQGVPFIHGGEEFARTKQGHHNSYNAPDDINQVDWSRKQTYHDLFAYVRDLVAVRKSHPAFRLPTKDRVEACLRFHATPDHHTILYTIDAAAVDGETWRQICVVVNASDNESIDLGLPPGPWHVALDHHGAIIGERVIEDTVRVRHKSGQILFQP